MYKVNLILAVLISALIFSACGENTKTADSNSLKDSDIFGSAETIIDEKALNIKSNKDLLANDKKYCGEWIHNY